MIDSMADINARMPMTRTIRGPYDAPNMWLEDTISLAKMYGRTAASTAVPRAAATPGPTSSCWQGISKARVPNPYCPCRQFDSRVEAWETTQMRLEEFYDIRGLL
jgi:hypothetical protein